MRQRPTHPGRCVCWRDSRNKFVVVSSSSCIMLVPYYVAPVRAPRGDCMVLGQGGRGRTNGAAIKGRKSWAWPCHDRVSKTAQSESKYWRWAKAARSRLLVGRGGTQKSRKGAASLGEGRRSTQRARAGCRGDRERRNAGQTGLESTARVNDDMPAVASRLGAGENPRVVCRRRHDRCARR